MILFMSHALALCDKKTLRFKIDSIITRGTPVPDPDCPEDAESVRFWCTSGGNFSERERTKIQGKATTMVETTGDALAAMVGPPELINGPAVACGNRPTLKSLVDVAANGESGTGSGTPAAPKAKAKSKAKAKAVAQQVPKTPAEQRTAIRTLFLYRY